MQPCYYDAARLIVVSHVDSGVSYDKRCFISVSVSHFSFGVLGYAMMRARMSAGPFIIGYILAPIAEVQLRSGLMIYDGSFLPLLTRPVSLGFLLFAVVTAFWPLLRRIFDRRRAPNPTRNGEE